MSSMFYLGKEFWIEIDSHLYFLSGAFLFPPPWFFWVLLLDTESGAEVLVVDARDIFELETPVCCSVLLASETVRWPGRLPGGGAKV